MTKMERTFSGEIEKPVSNLVSGEPHGVSQQYFDRLGNAATLRGDDWHYHDSQVKDGYHLGVVSTSLGEQGLDNGTNLLETALPVSNDLESLGRKMQEDLSTVQRALEEEGATVINMSIHPLGSTDEKSYQTYVAPKGIYPYIWSRGWDHRAGIDAKAQNSPTTGVDAEEAADAVSIMIGLGAATVGLFGNSPVTEGKVSGYKEVRLTMWDRMMGNSRSEGDRKTARYPDARFHDLSDYIEWMFGEGTGIHFVQVQNEGDYKTSSKLITVDGDPAVLAYLAGPEWVGTVFGMNEKIVVKPQLAHLEAMQFAQFTGARIRWEFNGSLGTEEFLEAYKRHGLEELFARGTKYMYIEGRDPGANFPDKQLVELGGEVSRSIVIAPAAIQAGLLNNLSESTRILDSYRWEDLGRLRDAAIKEGLEGRANGLSVRSLAEKVVEAAVRGLKDDQQWMLAYPRHVLQTGKNGADRFLQQLGDNTDWDSIAKAVIDRNVVLNK